MVNRTSVADDRYRFFVKFIWSRDEWTKVLRRYTRFDQVEMIEFERARIFEFRSIIKILNVTYFHVWYKEISIYQILEFLDFPNYRFQPFMNDHESCNLICGW